ncbi:MAG: TatD family hydrolase [Gammaproteobacteria bacterium]|nr:TatD family hydrolase [Gammaproteobacteria bacterium]
MFFDSHCHLDRIDLGDYDNSFSQLLESIKTDHVTRMLCIGVNLESFDDMYECIQAYPDIFCSAGVHPDYQNVSEPDVEQLCDLAKNDKVVAIGETGLDYVDGSNNMDWQRQRFIVHIEAAKQSNLPLIIHTRNARQDTLDILQENNADRVGGAMHCFTEDWEMAQQLIEMNFYISISGIVTFGQGENVRQMAKMIPRNRLLIETDAPWLSPMPFRGKPNHPGRVRYVAEKLAEIRNEPLEEVAAYTFENANRLFRLQ